MAWRNLYSKKLRSLLTVAGVIIGIGSIFFLLSLGLGLQSLVTQEVVGNRSIQSIDVTSPNSRIIKLNQESVKKIRDLSRVQSVGASYSSAGSITYNGSEVDGVAYGIDYNFQELADLQVTEGTLLKKDAVDGVMINTALLSSIGIGEDKIKEVIGKNIDIKIPLTTDEEETKEFQQTFTIVGIISSGSGGEVFLPSILLDQAGAPQYSQAKVLADPDADIAELRKQIESQGFSTTSPMDTINEINQIFRYFNIILIGFGAIGMIIAILGMFNTLTISLLERTKEIGLMLALGGRRKDMRLLFIIEAVLLSVIGSSAGIFLATIAGQIVNLLMNGMASGRGVTQRFDLFATPIWLIVALMLFMVLVGLSVVLLPARRAEKINLVNALRRE